MSYRTYRRGGVFITTDINPPDEYNEVFDISDSDAYEIQRGANLSVVDGQLVIDYVPYPPEEVIEG